MSVASDVVVRAEGLSKRYQLGQALPYRTLRDSLARAFRSAPVDAEEQRTIWAVRDVSFEVERGEVLGIIGRNGGGKSTLLKLLTRITEPTCGRAEVRGRVGSLLEVGTGFHPELTGRENIFLNGAILGMKRAEIREKFDEIVAFSEVEKFLDTPVKRYSSGMRVRLAFAVAAHLDPEILVIDEVLAVGDAAFQSKCLGKMGDAARGGRTILFVSHNMSAVQALCDRCLLLDEGRLVGNGPTAEVVGSYLCFDAAERAEFGLDTKRTGNGDAVFLSARLLDARGGPTASVGMGEPLGVEMEFQLRCEGLSQPSFGVEIHTPSGQPVTRLVSRETRGEMPGVVKGGRVRLDIHRLDLLPGTYYLTLVLSNAGENTDLVQNALRVEVTPRAVYPTGKYPPPQKGFLIFAPCSWRSDYE